METIKVWIPQADMNLIKESKRPTQFWVTKPNVENVLELTITFKKLEEWQSNGKRQILTD